MTRLQVLVGGYDPDEISKKKEAEVQSEKKRLGAQGVPAPSAANPGGIPSSVPEADAIPKKKSARRAMIDLGVGPFGEFVSIRGFPGSGGVFDLELSLTLIEGGVERTAREWKERDIRAGYGAPRVGSSLIYWQAFQFLYENRMARNPAKRFLVEHVRKSFESLFAKEVNLMTASWVEYNTGDRMFDLCGHQYPCVDVESTRSVRLPPPPQRSDAIARFGAEDFFISFTRHPYSLNSVLTGIPRGVADIVRWLLGGRDANVEIENYLCQANGGGSGRSVEAPICFGTLQKFERINMGSGYFKIGIDDPARRYPALGIRVIDTHRGRRR